MVWSIFVIIGAAAICWIDVPRLRRNKAVKERWAFGVLLTVAAGLGIAQSMRVRLPNPLDWIFSVFRPISDWMSL
ncbi:hypothetical protein GE107_09850 [Cohnella sp. CFH 77786]|uniref:hypothetical protein n=1 Tax=Cohnella sp. CFH 77786 TaxID=2662265 RepID=UPI001C60CFC0|nr:hypothetical protein [Cohnella sp. CFH 77786]MBW5446362.1 hypothetical protein [Cohnella sp. CFH 77786]